MDGHSKSFLRQLFMSCLSSFLCVSRPVADNGDEGKDNSQINLVFKMFLERRSLKKKKPTSKTFIDQDLIKMYSTVVEGVRSAVKICMKFTEGLKGPLDKTALDV